MAREFEVIDLFAGPGGLGEGFAATGRETGTRMKIRMSVEKEPTEVQTLRLRAFLRSFEEGFPPEYHEALNSGDTLPDWNDLYPRNWAQAVAEARQLELGEPGVFEEIAEVLDRTREELHGDTILIGGPPCQAYSLVGRARNRGKARYVPEDDGRHFLYREYVKILNRLRPAAFVMENVKGMLSSTVDGGAIFNRVLDDLRNAGDGYTLVPLSAPIEAGVTNARDFLVQAEDHGVPQARHRVFIVGLRSDVAVPEDGTVLLEKSSRDARATVKEAIFDLPRLRSGLSRGDGPDSWHSSIAEQAQRILASSSVPLDVRSEVGRLLKQGISTSMPRATSVKSRKVLRMHPRLREWVIDPALRRILHHESRGHIANDLGRYLFSAAWAKTRNASPKLDQFPSFLQPEHRNRESGKFKDRFRTQVHGLPSSTVTSHISKDGHYFIHPDPTQVRSLTVREAARLQTFPDNYCFKGNRTAQYHQVGNAVPPFLALQIGRVIRGLVDSV